MNCASVFENLQTFYGNLESAAVTGTASARAEPAAEARGPPTLAKKDMIGRGSAPSTYPAPITSVRSSTLPSVQATRPSQECRRASCWC
jgi:hypothetical protein